MVCFFFFSFSQDSASSVSDREEPLARNPVKNWADHMELADKPEPTNSVTQPLEGLAACHEDDDLLDIHGLLGVSGAVRNGMVSHFSARLWMC